MLICVLAVSCSYAAARVEKDVTTLNIGVKVQRSFQRPHTTLLISVIASCLAS